MKIFQQETQEKFEKLQDKVDEQIDQVGSNLGQVGLRHQVNFNKEKIEEIQRRELTSGKSWRYSEKDLLATPTYHWEKTVKQLISKNIGKFQLNFSKDWKNW